MINPIVKINERIQSSKEDSDVAYFLNLMYSGEQLIKLFTCTLVSCVAIDKQRHKYSQLYKLVRADGIGDWSTVIDEILTGPTSQFLLPESHHLQRELTERVPKGNWQYDANILLNSCLKNIDKTITEIPSKTSGRNWFSLFAMLRNKTRGHGAIQHDLYGNLCMDLQKSIDLFSQNSLLFKLKWAYLYRNLSGKYRVTNLSPDTNSFDYLKSNKDENLKNGVYIFLNRPVEVELLVSDADASDFLFPNGGFNGKRYECLSYITGNKEYLDATPFLTPSSQLPTSETQGMGKLEIQGKTFSNLPSPQKKYIQRYELEEELRNVLLDDRHPVVTLVGRGGIGKTTLAISVLKQISSSERFDAILWFSARDIDLLMEGSKPVKPHVLTEVDIADEFVSLVEPKERTDKYFKSKPFFEAELSKSSIGPFIIILDNFETVKNPVDLYQWLNTYIRLPNKILITSRFRDFKADYPIEVKGMTEKEFRLLVETTAADLNIPSGLITEHYLEELFLESDGHPYVVKILLGDLAKSKKIEKIKRIVAGKDELLTVLFERTYANLTPAARRIFKTLSSWRSTIPKLAVEAILMRGDNELMDVEAALEELARYSLIQIIPSKKDGYYFLFVPLTAAVFGQRKLSVSASKASIEADMVLLQAFGPGNNTQIENGIAPRINTFFKNIAKKISQNKEDFEKYKPILEYICRQFPAGWITLAALYREEGLIGDAMTALQRCIELTDSDTDITEAWIKISQLCVQTSDRQGEAHALVEIITLKGTPFSYISSAINKLIHLFLDHNDMITNDERDILIRKVIGIVSKRLENGEGTEDDNSNLAWLHIFIGDRKNAKLIVKSVLTKNPQHFHSLKLARKLDLT